MSDTSTTRAKQSLRQRTQRAMRARTGQYIENLELEVIPLRGTRREQIEALICRNAALEQEPYEDTKQIEQLKRLGRENRSMQNNLHRATNHNFQLMNYLQAHTCPVVTCGIFRTSGLKRTALVLYSHALVRVQFHPKCRRAFQQWSTRGLPRLTSLVVRTRLRSVLG